MKHVALVAVLVAPVAGCSTKDYQNRMKTVEAKLYLHRLQRAAASVVGGTSFAGPEPPKGQFLIGKVAATPATPCCKQPQHTCQPDPADWSALLWQAHDFQVDEPFRFQYSYESDGKTMTATAVGDLDCDGRLTTFTLTGTIENGVAKFVEPE